MATTQFTIEASKYYLNSKSKTLFPTNIELKEGDLLKVNFQGVLQKLGSSYKYDKNTDNPDFEFPVASLIGTIDEGKTFFPVAGNLEMMYLDQNPGKLSLVFWGVDASTTIGSATVTVEVEQQRALNEIKATTDASNALFQDRFQFAVHANANSVARKTAPGYGGDGYKIPEPLLETGIQLKSGDLLIVDVPPKDFWTPDGGFFTNANAIALDGNRGYWRGVYKAHAYRVSSLVATIDDGKTFFPVGTHLQMTVLNAGMLSFVCWDVDWTNNFGFVKACVKVIRNGKVLTYLDIKTIIATGNASTSGSGTSNGTGSNYSNLDCSTNLPKLSAKLKSDLSAAQ